MRVVTSLAVFALSLVVAGSAAASKRNEPQLIWQQEFNTGAELDERTWNYDRGAGGWGNEELQFYTDRPENVRVENGHLVITARPGEGEAQPFTSARVHTEGKFEFKYGVLVARIQLPDLADGLWPAFWALGSDFGEVGWPDCGELDIMELGHSDAIADGLVNRRVGSAAHWEHKNEHALYHDSLDAAAELDEGFHIYRMTWTPEFVQTSLDGEPIWTMDLRKRSCRDCSEFHQPFFVILNLAVGGKYPGRLEPGGITAPMPAEMRIDYVRLYDNSFTEISGSSVRQATTE